MFFDTLLAIHLVAIAFAYGAGFAGGETSRTIHKADPEMREPIWALLMFFFKVKAGAFVVLLTAGLWQIWIKGMTIVEINWVFWLKIGAVVVSIISTTFEIRLALKWRGGDEAAFKSMDNIGHITGLSMTTAIVAAAFAFH